MEEGENEKWQPFTQQTVIALGFVGAECVDIARGMRSQSVDVLMSHNSIDRNFRPHWNLTEK